MESQTKLHFDPRAKSYLAGIGVTHSIAPPVHDYVAQQLGHNWRFTAQECPTVEDAMTLFRAPDFAGGVVTMPYKVSIMQHLDGLDDYARTLGACNNVYRSQDGSLRGTNTDWRGIYGCLASATPSETCVEGRRQPAVLIGAGGAARAALYVLHKELACNPIYVVNRDKGEVEALLRDAEVYGSTDTLTLVHLESTIAAQEAQQNNGLPFYIVGTVPDFEPKTDTELEARAILKYFLSVDCTHKGVVLDMCFKPRRTRAIMLAEKYGWTVVEGIDVIGHQLEEQYRLWCGSSLTDEIKKGAWEVLRKTASESKMINF